MKDLVAVVTARGGSRGIPGKNIKPLGGVPLIGWTIQAALQSPAVQRVIVSTDDPAIARVSLEYGAEVPFMRPAHLAADDSAHFDVILHTLDWLESNGGLPSHLLTLQPTTPFRTPEDITQAAEIARSTNAPAVLGVYETKTHPVACYQVETGGWLKPFMGWEKPGEYVQRQTLTPAYVVNGAIFLNTCESIYADQSLLPPGSAAYVMPEERSLDIDTPRDFLLAEWMLSLQHRPAA